MFANALMRPMQKMPESRCVPALHSAVQSSAAAVAALPVDHFDRCLSRCACSGDLILSLRDTALAAETCEELFTPHAPHIALALNGVEIISNGSGSHHQLRRAARTASVHSPNCVMLSGMPQLSCVEHCAAQAASCERAEGAGVL
jgi:hypothetical protein